ncbi:hypothetical protein GCM10010293_53400 [Streptomyces griseoflavus]|uniref:DUF6087 family protein n=1 Tax=Streptomyces griseoflavus TaxID=35619 RepID=UPI00167D84E2|nr:DUF6087 family protein [Streptomyces griseoflavus]GGV45398.1 hypothetical protein GCM10010293_53400 [Streptomyces griseoflavus]
MEDEPLDEWAAHREQQRPRPGERRAVPLGEQAERGSHVDPDVPRGIQEWNGHEWIPAGIADDHQAAAAETGQDSASRAERVPLPAFSKLPPAPEPWRPTEPWHRP